MSSLQDFCAGITINVFVPFLEAMLKLIVFYHDKVIDMLKLGFTSPNVAKNCFQKSTIANIYPFTERGKDILEKNREDVVGGPSNVFTREAVVAETFIRKSANICKSINEIDASQLYPYSMSQPMLTGPYTRWEFDSQTTRFTPRQKFARLMNYPHA